MRDVIADLLHRYGRLVRGQIVQAQEAAAAADFARVAGAGFRTAGFADAGVVLEAGAAVAFLAVFEAGEVGLGAAEGLAGFDGHAAGAGVGGAGERAGGHGVVGAA